MYKKIGLLIFVLFAITACGRRTQTTEYHHNESPNFTQPTGVVDMPVNIQSGEVLTIMAPFASHSRVTSSAEEWRDALAAQGIDIELAITTFMPEEWSSEMLLGKYAAGVGPDVFIRGNIFLYPFIENEFIADILELIDNSATFSRDDFFTNALYPGVGGHAYMLPLHIGMEYVGINVDAPPSIVNRFRALDRARPSDLAELYLDLVQNYPAWGEHSFIHGMDANQAFAPEFNAMDFHGRNIDLAGHEQLLENLRAAFNHRPSTGQVNFSRLNAEESLRAIQQEYVFSRTQGLDNGIFGLFEFRDPYFMYYVPLASENGALTNRAFGLEMVAYANANPCLVLGFMVQVVSDTMHESSRQGQNVPILREYFHSSLESTFHQSLTQFTPPPMVQGESFAVADAIERMEVYANWLVQPNLVNYLVPSWVPMVPLMEFWESDADISAYEALREVEAATTNWLNAERPEITPFVYIPEFTLPDLPARTLTIRTDNRHTAIIQQAAEAINREWYARGENYIFEVIIEDHVWTDWQGTEARANRLRTELMAGEGPDLLIYEGFMDMHALAASGFVQDIFPLIDACLVISREDLFMQPLHAFEKNGGLFQFPVSFGFYYIGINADMPQEFIDRFAAMDMVSYTDLMHMYLELHERYGDEFGHITFDIGEGISHSSAVFGSIMGSFVDYNTRTSYLNTPEFAEFLELYYRIYGGGWDVLGMTSGNVGTTGLLRQHAREFMFLSQSWSYNSFDAFFEADPAIFKHHIPLADGQGRLMLDYPGNMQHIWAGISITTRADGVLAWELVRNMVEAYINPYGRAAVDPVHGVVQRWGLGSFATPIFRTGWEDRTLEVFEHLVDRFGMHMQDFVGHDDDATRRAQFNQAVSRIAAYNEMEMGLLRPGLPWEIFADHLDYFLRGIITAETAAQRMHNAISLWLIE